MKRALGVVVLGLVLAGCSGGGSEVAPTTTTTVPPLKTIVTSDAPTPAVTEQAFIDTLNSYGLDTSDRAAAIKLATSICGGLGRGLQQSDVLAPMVDQGYTLAEATNFMNTSIVSYCPEQA